MSLQWYEDAAQPLRHPHFYSSIEYLPPWSGISASSPLPGASPRRRPSPALQRDTEHLRLSARRDAADRLGPLHDRTASRDAGRRSCWRWREGWIRRTKEDPVLKRSWV